MTGIDFGIGTLLFYAFIATLIFPILLLYSVNLFFNIYQKNKLFKYLINVFLYLSFSTLIFIAIRIFSFETYIFLFYFSILLIFIISIKKFISK